MAGLFQSIRGMKDILPADMALWNRFELHFRHIMNQYGFEEIRLPLLEKTELFTRGVGTGTDVVSKEMYSFVAPDNENLSLRPEGTASCVRAGIENGLLYHKIAKLAYMGPMFRYERPQKGRYRQFHQAGMEVFGVAGPEIEAELIFMMARLFALLHLEGDLIVHVNALGGTETRAKHRAALVAYFQQHQSQLDADSQVRLQVNPLRILDSKNPAMAALISEAPSVLAYLNETELSEFEAFCTLLKARGISYVVNPQLVRGLDYYNGLVFEWITDKLGSQSAVCAGGRYDGLVGLLGGEPTPAIGLAIGLERVIELMRQSIAPQPREVDIYIATEGGEAKHAAMLLAETLRDEFPSTHILTEGGQGSLKAQIKRAVDKGTDVLVTLGERELTQKEIQIKHLKTKEQVNVAMVNASQYLGQFFARKQSTWSMQSEAQKKSKSKL